VVAGEHGALPHQGEAEMVGRVTWGVQDIERDASGLDHVAVFQRAVRREGWVDEGAAEAGRAGAAAAACWAEAQDLAAD